MGMEHATNDPILRPGYADFMRSPLGRSSGAAIYAMAAFNDGSGDPIGVLRPMDRQAMLEAKAELTRPIGREARLLTPIVFTAGADVRSQDTAASGEAGIDCRIPDTPEGPFV